MALSDRHGGTGPLVRLALLLQVTVVVVLAAVLAGLVVWLARRPALHVRLDLTADSRGTLSPVVADLCEQIPDRVDVDIFFGPLPPQVQDSYGRAQGLMRELLFVARNQYPTRLRVIDHDLADVAGTRTRMEELGVRDEDVVVFRRGDQRAILRLYRDAAEIDTVAPAPGQVPRAELVAFHGQQAFGSALRRVLAERVPLVCFSTGQGERDPFGAGDTELSGLRALLETDGFEVAAWEPEADGDVPADCDVLALIGPVQPFSEAALTSIRAFVDGGGRLIAAPDARFSTGPGSVGELLAESGIGIRPGFVCRPTVDRFRRPVRSGRDCLDLRVASDGLNSNHPITRPLWREQQSVRFVGSRAFERASAPLGAALHDLAYVHGEAWLDLPDGEGLFDWAWNPEAGEPQGRWTLAMVAELPVRELVRAEGARAIGADERPRARVMALGTPDALANAPVIFANNSGFLLNAFNWLASREYLITVDEVQLENPRVDTKEGSQLATIQAIATFGLPGLCLLLGVLLWWRRSR